jgi:hypothetical protein
LLPSADSLTLRRRVDAGSMAWSSGDRLFDANRSAAEERNHGEPRIPN